METNALTIFEHKDFGKVRTLLIDREPWAVAKDVAVALGYADTKQAVKLNCKKIRSAPIIEGVEVRTPPNIIGESDIFRLIMRSRLPTAEAFQDWVCEEVLPSLRKTGSYSVIDTRSQSDEEHHNVERAHLSGLKLMQWGVDHGYYTKADVKPVLENAIAVVEGKVSTTERRIDVSTFLLGKGVNAKTQRKEASKFGKALVRLYRAKYKCDPIKSQQIINGRAIDVFIYYEKDLDLFEQTYRERLANVSYLATHQR